MQVGKYREYHITFSRYVCQMIGGALNMHPIYGSSGGYLYGVEGRWGSANHRER